MAKITICLLTYARTVYARKTLHSTLDNIHCIDNELRVHIADDGSPAEHRRILQEMASQHPYVLGVTVSNSMRGGYGRNFNLATQVTHHNSDYILPLEDDWELVRTLNLDDLVRDLEREPRINCIRLGYLSFTQELRGQVIDVNNRKYLLLDPSSAEPHIFAGHPRLERVSFQRSVGPWPEGREPGATEFTVAHSWAARQGVAWPMDVVRPCGDLFAHIGTIRSTEVPDAATV